MIFHLLGFKHLHLIPETLIFIAACFARCYVRRSDAYNAYQFSVLIRRETLFQTRTSLIRNFTRCQSCGATGVIGSGT